MVETYGSVVIDQLPVIPDAVLLLCKPVLKRKVFPQVANQMLVG